MTSLSSSSTVPIENRPKDRSPLLAGAIIAVATALAYANSFSGVFLLDDRRSILANPTLRQLWPLGPVRSPAASSATVSGRPVANLSFALNYAAGGLNVWGYHAVNLAIHLAAALALFGLVRRTLLLPRWRDRWSTVATPLAAGVALLWALHPLQTEAVTYIVQRVESLMGLCYFLTLYAYARAATGSGRLWSGIAVGACALGMATKEVIASAPLIALLYDRTFISGTFREAWRNHRALLLGLAATWTIVAALVISGGGNRGGSIGFGTGIGAWDYWLTQPRALSTYLGRTLWPHPLIFEYGADWIRSVGEVVPYAVGIVALVAGTIFALWRRPVLGFLGIWFFAILAPTSLMPGVSQLTVEHRMYLPLAAVLVLLIASAHLCLGRRSWLPFGVLACASGVLTLHRNADYHSVVGLWQDTVAKRPHNPLAQDNLATALRAAGRFDSATAHHAIATDLAPGVAGFHYTYGVTLMSAGRPADAVREFAAAARLAPDWVEARHDLGIAQLNSGDANDAIESLAFAAAREPNRAPFDYDYGTALLRAGQAEAATKQFRAAIRLDPNHELAHHDLGAALAQLGRYEDALAEFQTAVRLAPNDLRAHDNLANILAALGRFDEARAEFNAVLRRDPSNAAARDGLARIDAVTGKAQPRGAP